MVRFHAADNDDHCGVVGLETGREFAPVVDCCDQPGRVPLVRATRFRWLGPHRPLVLAKELTVALQVPPLITTEFHTCGNPSV
jgi:hypothetical protein